MNLLLVKLGSAQAQGSRDVNWDQLVGTKMAKRHIEFLPSSLSFNQMESEFYSSISYNLCKILKKEVG